MDLWGVDDKDCFVPLASNCVSAAVGAGWEPGGSLLRALQGPHTDGTLRRPPGRISLLT